MWRIKIIVALVCSLHFRISNAQQYITLDQVIAIGMEHNFGLKISKNDIEIAENNLGLSNAGLLPSLDLNINGSLSSLDTKIEFLGDVPAADQKGAVNTLLSPSLDLSYTVFDGGKNRYKLESLREDRKKQKINYTANMEKTLIDLINAYYNVVNIQSNLDINISNYSYSLERYIDVSREVKFGQNTELERLTTLGYMNTDSTKILNSQLLLQKGFFDLNGLLGLDTLKGDEIFTPTIELNFEVNKHALIEKMLVNNTDIRTAMSDLHSSKLDVKSTKYFYLPKLSLKASYAYSNQEFEVGTMLSNQTLGPTIGFTLSRNITSGGKDQRAAKNAYLTSQNSQLRLDETKVSLEHLIEKAWLDYEYYLALISIEQSNAMIAEERFVKTQEMYKFGQVSNLEIRDAQLSWVKAISIYNETRINAKLAEWELMKIAGLIAR